MNKYKKLFSNTVIFAVGSFSSKLLVFLLMPFYTAWLSTAEFGAAEVITGLSNFIIPVACVGLTTGIFRFAAEKDADHAAVFSSSLALLGCGLAGFLLLSPLLFLVEYLRPNVWLIVLYVLLADVQAVCAQYLRGIERNRLFAGQGILNTCVNILAVILFVRVLRMSTTGYVLAVAVGNAVTIIFMVIAAKLWRVFRPSKIDRSLMKALLRFSVPMIPVSVCWLITDLSDRMMVTYYCGESVNGLYSAAYKIPNLVNIVSGFFLQAWQFSAVSESEDKKERSLFFSEVFSGFLAVVTTGAAVLILCSRTLTRLLLNVSYFDAWEYMPTLLCAAVLAAIDSFMSTVYLVHKKSIRSLLTALSGALTNVVLNLILIPRMGALGAAIATLASYGIVMLIRTVDAQRFIPFGLRLPRFISGTVLLFAAAVLMTVDPPMRLLWTAIPVALAVAINLPALFRACLAILKGKTGRA